MSVIGAAVGPSTYWYLTRSTGAVALLLLTLTVALGVIDVRRYATPRWPRFVIDGLHRNVALLTIVFLVLHILTSVLDSFAPIALLDAVIPFAGSYRPFWLGLGRHLVRSAARRDDHEPRAPPRRPPHVARGALALLRVLARRAPARLRHGQRRQGRVAAAAERRLPIVVATSVLVRVAAGWPEACGCGALHWPAPPDSRCSSSVWLPAGPLGSEWARRSGTPSALLGKAKTKRTGRERLAMTDAATRPRLPRLLAGVEDVGPVDLAAHVAAHGPLPHAGRSQAPAPGRAGR